jgi:hypothetical protein
MEIKRIGEKMAFLDLCIGQPFFAHGRLWTRTSFSAGTELHGSHSRMNSACDFLKDGTVEPKRGPYSRAGETCEEVEAVVLVE